MIDPDKTTGGAHAVASLTIDQGRVLHAQERLKEGVLAHLELFGEAKGSPIDDRRWEPIRTIYAEAADTLRSELAHPMAIRLRSASTFARALTDFAAAPAAARRTLQPLAEGRDALGISARELRLGDQPSRLALLSALSVLIDYTHWRIALVDEVLHAAVQAVALRRGCAPGELAGRVTAGRNVWTVAVADREPDAGEAITVFVHPGGGINNIVRG